MSTFQDGVVLCKRAATPMPTKACLQQNQFLFIKTKKTLEFIKFIPIFFAHTFKSSKIGFYTWDFLL